MAPAGVSLSRWQERRSAQLQRASCTTHILVTPVQVSFGQPRAQVGGVGRNLQDFAEMVDMAAHGLLGGEQRARRLGVHLHVPHLHALLRHVGAERKDAHCTIQVDLHAVLVAEQPRTSIPVFRADCCPKQMVELALV